MNRNLSKNVKKYLHFYLWRDFSSAGTLLLAFLEACHQLSKPLFKETSNVVNTLQTKFSKFHAFYLERTWNAGQKVSIVCALKMQF